MTVIMLISTWGTPPQTIPLPKNALHCFEVAELEMSIGFEVGALGPFIPRVDGN